MKFSFLLKQPACDFGPRPACARPPGPLARQPTTGPPNRPGATHPPFPHGPHPGPRAAQAPLAVGFRSDGRPAISADQNRQAPMLPQTLTIFISPPPFSQHTEQRRPLGGLARAGGSPATVRSGTAGTWSGSYPFPLCFLSPFLSLSTMRQRPQCGGDGVHGGRRELQRRRGPPRRRVPSPLSEGAAVERFCCGARASARTPASQR